MPVCAVRSPYARTRQGDIAFAVRTETSFAGYRPDHQEWSASVLKAMLLAAYLNRPSVASRNLAGNERALLTPMITVSDNAAADTVDEIVGAGGLQALARRVGMTRFAAAEPIWGESEITPRGGWGSGTGLIDNQVALLTRGCARVSIAVLTMHDGSHAYGKQTLRALFHALLVGLPTGRPSRYR